MRLTLRTLGVLALVAGALALSSMAWVCQAGETRAHEYSRWNPLRYLDFREAQPAAETEKQPPATKPARTQAPEPVVGKPGAVIETQRGDIVIELLPGDAPVTVRNFQRLVGDRFYDSQMKFHRVVPGFVVQTGDPTGTGYGGSEKKIPLEVKNKLKHNTKGVVAMARGASPDSATSQFYITLSPQDSLDGKYAIFGRVIKGMDVLDKIQQGDRLYGIRLMDASAVTPDPVAKKSLTDTFTGGFKGLFGKKSQS